MEAVRYVSLADLFARWGAGAHNIDPARSTWDLAVYHDVLVHRRADGQPWTPLGLPVRAQSPRFFWYLVTAFRRKLALRARLEDYGGVPCLPFEFASLLHERFEGERGTALALGVPDVYRDDVEARAFILNWATHPGERWNAGLNWRSARIQAYGPRLDVGRIVRGQPATTTVAELESGGLRLLGQARRSPAVLWVRDALYVSLGRALATGELPEGYQVRRLGAAGASGRWAVKEELLVRAIPQAVVEAMR